MDGASGHKDIPKDGRLMEYARLTAESSNTVVNRFYEIYENEGMKGLPKKASV
jgi:hypothetical protein